MDPNKHTVSLVMQARVGVGMNLFTYLFLFSQFSNIQNVFGTIHPTWNILVWKDILLELLVQLVGNFIFVREKSEIFKHV